MNTAIVPGSLRAIAQQTGRSLAESFISADVVVIVDTSGSMMASDARDGQSRYAVACEELRNLQATLPGRVAVISFNTWPEFNPGGIPGAPIGNTNMARALDFARVADLPGMSFFLISDGAPDNAPAAMAAAKEYRNNIHTIYVGPEGDSGQHFLAELAAATGGRHDVKPVDQLEAGIKLLLSSGGGTMTPIPIYLCDHCAKKRNLTEWRYQIMTLCSACHGKHQGNKLVKAYYVEMQEVTTHGKPKH